ncbi:hypothetical protein BTVI_48144 [Pitangus sulphuratus]|nr:hypothetical protein BTVI_48144 [Pitangus sulphuratus]
MGAGSSPPVMAELEGPVSAGAWTPVVDTAPTPPPAVLRFEPPTPIAMVRETGLPEIRAGILQNMPTGEDILAKRNIDPEESQVLMSPYGATKTVA